MTAQSPLTTLRPLYIRHETADKDKFMPLLLLGDEQREAVERYLYAGDLYVGSVKGEDMAVCVVCAGTGANGADTDVFEIKNIAIAPAYRRKGFGRRILQWLETRYPGGVLTVGTGEAPSTMNFYRSCGYRYSHRIPGFFTRNYNPPIIDDGVLLKDMIYFKKDPAIRPITVPELYDALLTVWEAAVRDSHDFLSEADIRFFKTLIPDALPHLEVFGFFETGAHPDRLRGFAAIEDDRLEMLFVHPAAKGQGVGSRLMDFAIHDRNIRFVDVNEQNTQALQFYLHRGFQIIGRDAADAFGKPFPILHLTLP